MYKLQCAKSLYKTVISQRYIFTEKAGIEHFNVNESEMLVFEKDFEKETKVVVICRSVHV